MVLNHVIKEPWVYNIYIYLNLYCQTGRIPDFPQEVMNYVALGVSKASKGPKSV